jgi:hypothetical protein
VRSVDARHGHPADKLFVPPSFPASNFSTITYNFPTFFKRAAADPQLDRAAIGIGAVEGDANMNNSRERKRIYHKRGLRTTCLSRERNWT